jgi:hypothetical protein
MIRLNKARSLEIHIVLGCADARDVSSLQTEAIAETVKEFAEKGIDIAIKNIRSAGSFITQDVVMDIRRMIERSQRNFGLVFPNVRYYVHIQTHGELTEDSHHDYVSHLYHVAITPGSPLNCGMMNATPLAIDIEKMLIEEQLLVKSPKGAFVIKSERDISRMLAEVYGHKGHLAGDWIKSISYLRTHPREQKAKLEQIIETDLLLSRCHIQITAGIMDYRRHYLIRLDDGEPPVEFWDTMQAKLRQKVSDKPDTLASMYQKQKPLIGLISMADPDMRARASALKQYAVLKNKAIDFESNMVFQISGGGFDLPDSAFGPYVIGGFYYAVKYMELKDQVVMGLDQSQTQRILDKIKHDPIMNLICLKYEVNLIPMVLETGN